MVPEAADRSEDLEQLRRRFEEFRNAQPGYKRLPKPLWAAAVELAQRYNVNPTARALRLEYSGLRRRVENQRRPRRKRTAATPPNFLEFVAPGAKAVTNCTVEAESAQDGKLRLELKALATAELAELMRAFVSR